MSIASPQFSNEPFRVGQRVIACTAEWWWLGTNPLHECRITELSTSSWVKVQTRYRLFWMIPCRSSRWLHCYHISPIDETASEIAQLEKLAKEGA